MTSLTYLLIAGRQPIGNPSSWPLGAQAARAAVEGLWGSWRTGEVGSEWGVA